VQNYKKTMKNAKKMQKNLRMSKKSSTFAPAFEISHWLLAIGYWQKANG